MEFIQDNLANIIIIAVLAGLVALAVWRMVKQRKKGGCGCGCSSCPHSENCGGEPGAPGK